MIWLALLLTPIVSFTFDDCSETVATKALPTLEPYNIRATVYVTTDYVGRPGYVTLAQLRQLEDAGWEIGAHTWHHARLPDMPDYMALRELAVCRQQLAEWGFEVVTMATPYRASSAETQAVIPLAGYLGNRNGSPGHNYSGLDPFNIQVLTDLTHHRQTLRAYIDNVAAEDSWGVFVGHFVDERGIRASELLELALYARTRGVEIVTVKEGLERLGVDVHRPNLGHEGMRPRH